MPGHLPSPPRLECVPGRAIRAAVVGALLVVVLTGCSAVAMAYRNADRLALGRIEAFIELDPEQRETLGAALEAGLARHRRDDLPVLAARLRETGALVARGLDETASRRVLSLGLDAYRETARALIADVSPTLATLDPDQIDALAARMSDERERVREERLGGGDGSWAERRARNVVKRIERWTGRLDAGQRALVDELMRTAIPSRTAAWLRFSKRQEAILLAALRAGEGPEAIARRLRLWWVDDTERDAELLALTGQANEGWATLLTRLGATLTDAQRERAVTKLERYAGVFTELAGVAAAS